MRSSRQNTRGRPLVGLAVLGVVVNVPRLVTDLSRGVPVIQNVFTVAALLLSMAMGLYGVRLLRSEQ